MKTLPFAAILSGALLLAAPAFAQTASGAAAATLPGAFDEGAARSAASTQPPAQGPAQASAQASAQAPAQAPDIARSEEALRRVIADFQANQIDYAVFSSDMAEQIRAQSGAVAPLIQQFGPLKTIEHRGQQNGADLFRVVFDKQATDWVIAFNEDDLIAALLFRPAQD